MRRFKKPANGFLVGILATAMTPAILLGAACFGDAQTVGRVEATKGTPEVLRSGTTRWAPVKAGDPVSIGDQLRTRQGVKLKVRLQEDSVLVLAEKTVLVIDEDVLEPSGQNKSIFSLLLGKMRAIVADRYTEPASRFEVRTPAAVAGVRGTEFIAETTAVQSKFFGLESETVVQVRAFGVCGRRRGCGS